MAQNRESSLTSPADRNPAVPFRLDQTTPPLAGQQATEAVKALNNTAFVERFPAVERRFVDPAIDNQRIGLISFIPAKGATPDSQGIYGFAKLRGNFASEHEANERAEFIIRNVDSYHQVYHTFVGRPFPLTVSSDFSKEVSRVNLQKAAAEAISEDVKKKRDKEQQEIEEIKQREEELLADVKKTEENKDDRYTTLRVKKAQLVWTYVETEKKMSQMKGLIAKARREIEELEKEAPEVKETYYAKYIDARKKAGLPVDKQSTDESFMKYLVEDLVIPEVEEEYRKIYGSE